MKKYLYIILLAIIVVSSSCEEVIEIDLNSTNPHIVAEGYMEKDSVCKIRLSYTTDYFDVEEAHYIENSRVEVSDGQGNSEMLTYLGNGIYRGGSLVGIPEQNYNISFDVDEQEYLGEAYLFSEPTLQSVTYDEAIFQFPSRPGEPQVTSYTITLKILDEPIVENFFLISVDENDTIPPSFYLVMDDSFKNSDNLVEIPLGMYQFNLTDTVDISVYSIDEGAYRFYSEMNDAGGMGPAMMSQPYNPSSNMGDEVLGYFMARSRIDTTIILH